MRLSNAQAEALARKIVDESKLKRETIIAEEKRRWMKTLYFKRQADLAADSILLLRKIEASYVPHNFRKATHQEIKQHFLEELAEKAVDKTVKTKFSVIYYQDALQAVHLASIDSETINAVMEKVKKCPPLKS